ncbi:heme exporter protein CcmD [Niveibacterium sp. SC-1]|uniref:heme exporter protein CcmD n=1 Tax=Niveibacterium sp. SC-1 TaxID=3135646 RepID=UPI00311E3349
MNWQSPSEFFAMGGYALYVWGSVIACLVCVVVEPLLVRQRRRTILGLLRRQRVAERLEREESVA